jgi:hypothetical protein
MAEIKERSPRGKKKKKRGLMPEKGNENEERNLGKKTLKE